ncbi:PAS domain S-box protein [Mariprofundus sp. NF]|uniref:PAS domain-containing hybrid sensor histidine kinase/response regulator n=1 Tax=Mariprofundus sp. NF TaxID=2608716 RepID=UPI0015A08789|nr:PAS domain-containing sensor histidine kinase [Mariprofundus sp. NF]NWF37898.1 PAS domain S-box protein [Mariprofundus sp. NF]
MEGKSREFDARFSRLKDQAEELLREDPQRVHEIDAAHDLIHELQVYQAELEIQNEELRASQQALAASRDRFSYLYHEAPVGYVSLDRDGIVREANARMAQMLKVQLSDLIGKSLQNFIYPGDRDIYLGRYRAFYNAPDGKELELRMECSDNKVMDVLIEGRSATLKHEDISCDVLVLMVITDISERVAAEANLRLADKVIQTAQEAVIVTDSAGLIISVNPCFEKTTGYQKHEVIGKNPRILQSGRQDRFFYEQMWQEIVHKGQWQGIVWNRKKSGEEYAERLSISCIRDTRQHITHYVGVFTDITEQLELEEQLRQSQKMEAIGTLVGGIAHDFNNMLAGITGNLYLARKASADRPEVVSKLDVIEKLSLDAATMISQMLVFARKDLVRHDYLDLNRLVQQFSSSVARVTIPETIQLDVQLETESMVVLADATQIQQVILNLLSNARDAVAAIRQPEISIELERFIPDELFKLRNQHFSGMELVRLTVRDNGCGMDEEIQKRVFEPFYTTKEVGEGTGLGLSMVYGAVQGFDGLVEIDSQPDAGTAIHIYLPLHKAEIDDIASSDEEVPSLESRGELILIADDDAMVREVTSETLKNMGYRVIEAEDGSRLLDLFIEHRNEVDLVLLDMVMPKVSGWTAAEKLRRLRPDLPIIFMTGYDREHVLDEHGEMDNTRVLSKPFPPDQLNAAMRSLLT